MKNNIYRILLDNKRVNHYTKLLILLNTFDYYNDHYIPNKKLMRLLKTYKANVVDLLHQLEEDKIIKLMYTKKRRYFKFTMEEYKREEIKTNYDDIFNYDWLNEED